MSEQAKTPIHIRYQQETERDFVSGAQEVTRYHIYNECGLFLHLAECEDEWVAKRFVQLWNDAENGKVAEILQDLLSLIERETDLPGSARNGATDSTGWIDKGEMRAFMILEAARDLLAELQQTAPIAATQERVAK